MKRAPLSVSPVIGYRSTGEVGQLLGLTSRQVRELVLHGPLNGIRRGRSLLIHSEHLAEYQRLLGKAG